MSRRHDLAGRNVSSVVVPGSPEQLLEDLLRRPRWVERRMPMHDTTLGGFVYVERTREGFVAWSAEQGGAEELQSPGVHVTVRADPRGTRLEIRRVMPRSTRTALALVLAVSTMLVLLPLGLALVGAGPTPALLASIGVALAAVWGQLAVSWSRTTGRANHAWDELTSAVVPLALPEGDGGAPYRG